MSTSIAAVPDSENFFAVDNLKHGRGLIARRDLNEGEPIMSFADARTVERMDIYSVQVGRDLHVRHWIVDHLNHSCDSNVHFDVERRLIIASRDIDAGEELTFFYPSTEWSMLRPFSCGCGSANCIEWVAGAHALAFDVLNRYPLTPHVLAMLEEETGVEA